MNERFIILNEKYLNNDLSPDEKSEFELIINSDNKLKEDFEEQLKINEALRKMHLKNPSKETWDGYWLGIYNRLERGLAWIAISIGALIVFGFAAVNIADAIVKDTSSPFILKVGLGALFFGGLVLLFSVIREKFFTHKKDKYKEIQR